jgi:hypothetical protein
VIEMGLNMEINVGFEWFWYYNLGS